MAGSLLVVDDDRFFRELVTDVLARRGHRVVAVEDGARALEEAARARFDLVISDVVMPGVDGLELLRRLREADPEQEVLLVSQRPDVPASLTALEVGAADCLAKPLEEADLVLAVDRALERAQLRRERARLQDENEAMARTQGVHQRCLELLSQPDLEWLQERVLADLMQVTDAQGAALWLADEQRPGALALKAYRGLLDRARLADRLALEPALLERLRAGEPWTRREGASGSALWVPFVAQGEPLGLAELTDPPRGHFRAEAVRDAKTLGDFGAVGVRTGRRLLALQRLGLRDRETAAYNLSYFTDYASKEIYKARRYGRTFSLLTFSLDHLGPARLRLGAAEARRAVRGVTRALGRLVRDSDVVAKAGEGELYLLLPETDFFGALMFVRRALAAVREEADVQEVEARQPLGLVGGAATFPRDGDDFDELVHRCRRRMDERRTSLYGKLGLEGLSFWDAVELLLGGPDSPPLPDEAPHAEPSRRGKVADALFGELSAEVARELVRDPGARGLLYVGLPEVRADGPLPVGLEGAPPELQSRVYLLGRRADLDSHPALTPVFVAADERAQRHEFLLWLSESAAYALVQRRGRGATWGFHTSDTAVVDGLISKLQAEYDLQPL